MLKRIKAIEKELLNRVNPPKIILIYKEDNNRYSYNEIFYDNLEDLRKENNIYENDIIISVNFTLKGNK